jgi:hypothetical protein
MTTHQEDVEMEDVPEEDNGDKEDGSSAGAADEPTSSSKRSRQPTSTSNSPSSELRTKRGRILEPNVTESNPPRQSSRLKATTSATGPTESAGAQLTTRSSRSKSCKSPKGDNDDLVANTGGMKKLGH